MCIVNAKGIWQQHDFRMGRSFLLTVKSSISYGWSLLESAWSFLLTVEIRFGLFTYGSPRPEIGFGLLCLRFPPSGILI